MRSYVVFLLLIVALCCDAAFAQPTGGILVTVKWSPPVQNNTDINEKVRDEIIKTLNDEANLGYWAFSSDRGFPSPDTQPELRVTLRPREGQNQGIISFEFFKNDKDRVGSPIPEFSDLSINLAKDGGWVGLVKTAVKRLVDKHTTELEDALKNLPFTGAVAGLPEKVPFTQASTLADLTIRRGLNPLNNVFVLNASSSKGILVQFCSRAGGVEPFDKTFQKARIIIDKYKWGTDFVALNQAQGPLLTVPKTLKAVTVKWNWNNACTFSDNSVRITSPSVAPH